MSISGMRIAFAAALLCRWAVSPRRGQAEHAQARFPELRECQVGVPARPVSIRRRPARTGHFPAVFVKNSKIL
jgi:hypothetical protein